MDDGDSTNDNKPPLFYIIAWLRHSLYLLE